MMDTSLAIIPLFFAMVAGFITPLIIGIIEKRKKPSGKETKEVLDMISQLEQKHKQYLNYAPEYQNCFNTKVINRNNTTVHMSDYIKPKPRTCPNCGAPVRGSTCEYCNTEFY